jgi:hypothetical protein
MRRSFNTSNLRNCIRIYQLKDFSEVLLEFLNIFPLQNINRIIDKHTSVDLYFLLLAMTDTPFLSLLHISSFGLLELMLLILVTNSHSHK